MFVVVDHIPFSHDINFCVRVRKYVDQNGLAAMLATDFPDWKKFSKISLISLISGNPVVNKFG